MNDIINKIEHTEELVYNSAGQHVGTIHKVNGVETTRSWVIDGTWQHGKSDNASIPAEHTVSLNN